MHCVGDKESGELADEEVSWCSWVDKRMNSMNDMVISCKCEGILLCPIMIFVKIAMSKHAKVINMDVVSREKLRKEFPFKHVRG